MPLRRLRNSARQWRRRGGRRREGRWRDGGFLPHGPAGPRQPGRKAGGEHCPGAGAFSSAELMSGWASACTFLCKRYCCSIPSPGFLLTVPLFLCSPTRLWVCAVFPLCPHSAVSVVPPRLCPASHQSFTKFTSIDPVTVRS